MTGSTSGGSAAARAPAPVVAPAGHLGTDLVHQHVVDDDLLVETRFAGSLDRGGCGAWKRARVPRGVRRRVDIDRLRHGADPAGTVGVGVEHAS
ncbi:hypothetical protein ACFWVP_18055 [Streptomyces sp. NPDC058637]|uniref:hypothetical protein n=1 Tax=Streptomyces sp. NPDC058637 TaxID=3346569 RepID=UPI00364B90D0